MESSLPYLINFVAVAIAVFGLWQSAMRDYERQKEVVQDLRQQLRDCEQYAARLKFALERRGSSTTIHDSNVTVQGDIVGGDSSVGGDSLSSGRDVESHKGV